MSRQQKADISYYMPLSSGCSPKDGPSKSIFSVPKFNYSPETTNLVKNFMNESRLSFTQKNGFQAILRNGNALPTRPNDVFRQQLYKHRHAERARSMGLPVMSPNHHQKFPNSRPHPQFMRGCPTGGRRSFDSIKSSGVLDTPPIQTRQYIPCDKEKEKTRLAHRMAYGSDPPPTNKNPDGSFGPKVQGLFPKESVPRTKSSLLDERFYELVQEIQERIDLLESMKKLGNGRTYQAGIVSQVQELVTQMRSISVDKTNEFVTAFELEKLDKCFVPGGYQMDNILAL